MGKKKFCVGSFYKEGDLTVKYYIQWTRIVNEDGVDIEEVNNISKISLTSNSFVSAEIDITKTDDEGFMPKDSDEFRKIENLFKENELIAEESIVVITENT